MMSNGLLDLPSWLREGKKGGEHPRLFCPFLWRNFRTQPTLEFIARIRGYEEELGLRITRELPGPVTGLSVRRFVHELPGDVLMA